MPGELDSSTARVLALASREALRAPVAMMTPFTVLRGSIHLASVNALIYRLQRYLMQHAVINLLNLFITIRDSR